MGMKIHKVIKATLQTSIFNFQLISCTFPALQCTNRQDTCFDCEQLSKSFVELSLAIKSTGNFGNKKTDSIRNLIENSLIYFRSDLLDLFEGRFFGYTSNCIRLRKFHTWRLLGSANKHVFAS